MTDAVKNLIEKQLAEKQLGVCVVIGAGRATVYDSFAALGYEHFILVEADPRNARKLNKKFHTNDNVHVIDAAVVTEQHQFSESNTHLFQTSPARFSSVNKPNGLFKKLPQLAYEQVSVSMLSLTDVIESAQLNNELCNTLVLDTNGGEQRLLNDLTHDQLVYFDVIVMTIPNAGLYDELEANEDLTLQNHSYWEKAAEDEQSLATTELWLLDSKVQEITQLRQALERQTQRAETAEEQNESIQQQLKSVETQRTQAQQAAEQQSREQQKKIDALQEKMQQKESESAQLRADRDEKTQLNEKHKNWAESLQKQLEQAKSDLKEQQRSAQLSTKLLAKVEADAAELRERYSDKVKSEQELKELIKELHAKLQAASHFYHKLEQEHPELLQKL
ncbi:FkbM family methyltransferase [Idiomarina sp.]|uniref:FkbM family methyltransferase n=1 Tax=Idiomarina sp. TaxID=1874361 RepID=UPI0025C52451|nr:FkbM family methyltransferase [Idiomarina sp.]NQZ03474.1 FkbM family methyltransferase [Idiomarina sp.]